MSEKRHEFTTAALDAAETLTPTVLAYARNLLVATSLHERFSSEGVLVALENSWLREALWSWSQEHPSDTERPRGALFALLAETGGRPTRVEPAPGLFGANLQRLGRVLGLDRTERAVVQFVLAIRLVRDFGSVASLFGHLTTPALMELISVATGEPPSAVRSALAPEGRLRSTRFLVLDGDAEPLFVKLLPDVRLADFLTGPAVEAGLLADSLLRRAPAPTLALSDFDHVEPAVDRLRRLLAASLDQETKGVHVLVHGPSGAGKTELTRLLASTVGAEARETRADTAESVAAPPWTRLSRLLASERAVTGRSVLLYDDAEELFEPGGPWNGFRAEPKAPRSWLFRALERNRSPVIWTVRDPSCIDAGTLRRFAMVLELPALDESRRLALWNREAAGTGREPAMRRLARRLPASAAEIATAARTARIVDGGRFDPATAEAILEANLKAAAGAAPLPLRATGSDYLPDALNTSADLGAIAAQLAGSFGRDAQGVTLCLHGPSGTGKSQWVRHLAERLGRQLHVQRVADIESKWVGESEKAVARAFDRAEREGAVLLFDEADSFLRARDEAARRFEVTLTNEFLQRLEEARSIVACTTNCFDALDPAVLRRFDLKISFDYLRPAQATRLFASVFGPLLADAPLPEADALSRSLEELGDLAPGDFATVARRARLLGTRATADWFLGELRSEVAARGPHRARVAGFRVG